MDTPADMKTLENITKEDMQKIHNTIKDIFDEALYRLPVVMRLRYFYNMVRMAGEATIDWDKINDSLRKQISPWDYNNFYDVESLQDLGQAIAQSDYASLGMGYWRVIRCKQCGEEFFMPFSEIEFYMLKGFDLPKRCKTCRSKK